MAAAASSSASAAKSRNGTEPPDLDQQLEVIRKDIADLTEQMSTLVNHIKEGAMAQVKGQARRAKATADSALSDLQETGQETLDAFREVADTFGDAVEDSLKKRPYATLAIVAGIGFLFGAVWRR